MSKAEDHESEGYKLLDQVKFEDAAIQFNHASKEYEEERNDEKSRECLFMYKLVSGFSQMRTLTSVKDADSAKSDFEAAEKILMQEKDRTGLIGFVKGCILLTTVFQELWNPHSKTNLEKILNDAEIQFKTVKDEMPEMANIAEILRLEVLAEIYQRKAALSLPNDKVSSKRYAGQRKTTIQKIISLTQDDNAAAYYSGMSDCYDAILAFNEGYTSIEDDSEIALSFFKKSSELATKTIETLNKAQTIHRAKIFIQYNKGLVGAIKAVISYVGGRQNLLVGNSQLAKYDFEKAIKESTKAMEDSQIAGDFSLPLIQVLTNISESSRKFSQNISKTIRQSKRFGISAGSQFGVVFFVTLITFVVLGNFQLFLVSSYIEIYVSLTVASITAFGLNALKLKDLLLPIQSSK